MALDEKVASGPDAGAQRKYGDLAEDILQDFGAEARGRINFENQWQEVAELAWPENRGMFTWGNIVTSGEKRTQRQIDSTAQLAIETYMAICDSLLTPVDSFWHMLTNPDTGIMKKRQNRLWYDDVRQTLFDYRYLPQSGFVGQNQMVWKSTGSFGSGVLFIDEYEGPQKQRGLRYRNIPMGEAYFKENHQGNIDTLYRAFYMTPRQARQKWGDAIPESLMKRTETPGQGAGSLGAGTMARFIHCVRPRGDYDSDRLDDKGKYWESVYLSWDARTVLSTGAYETFPYAVSRFAVAPNEVYGRGPAMAVLPTIKTLNLEKSNLLVQGHRSVSPILLVNDDAQINMNMMPGAVNVGGVNADGRPLVHTLPIGDVQIGKEIMDDDKATIKDAFFIPLFQILTETPTMTATEVIERTREKATLLAPAMSRQVDYLGQLIEREMAVLANQNLLPAMPPEIQRAKDHYKVVFTSPLARAKKAEESSGTLRTIESITNIVNVTQDPSPLDWFDMDEITPALAENNAMPERFIRAAPEVMQIRQNRAQMQERQMKQQEAPGDAALLNAASKAKAAGIQPNALPRSPFPTAPLQ
jgi:hypothetical protein